MDRNRRQSERRLPQPVVVLIAATLFLIGIVSLTLFAVIIVGLFLPAIGLLELVRWINRRDDPQYVKLPRDPL